MSDCRYVADFIHANRRGPPCRFCFFISISFSYILEFMTPLQGVGRLKPLILLIINFLCCYQQQRMHALGESRIRLIFTSPSGVEKKLSMCINIQMAQT